MNATNEPGIRAAGAVLYRHDESGEPLVALVHRPHHRDWSLPKGKIDPGETPPVTAVREISEETGYSARLGPFLRRVHYEVPRTDPGGSAAGVGKSVDYFTAAALSGQFSASSEVDELRWLPVADAIELTSYSDDVTVLRSFFALPHETTTIALAQPAEFNDAADDQRTLSATGQRQAAALCDMLRTFEPTRVLTAPDPHCARTIRDCAAAIGVSVINDPRFAAENRPESADNGAGLLEAIVASGETTVVCAAGSVVTHLVDAGISRDEVSPLTDEAGDGTPDAATVSPARGSLWLLSFGVNHRATANGPDRPLLLTASYFTNPTTR